MKKQTVLIIGGGAAGFFAACQLAENQKNLKIIILEKDKEVLKKVRISGGGRCNVTHASFEPKELVKYYPRGQKELYSPFLHFQPSDTIEWFKKRGVSLKTESDHRIFPVSDSSSTIIDCFWDIIEKHKVEVKTNHKVTAISKNGQNWEVTISDKIFQADYLIITGGSSHSLWSILLSLGHSVKEPIPSLFTFKINDKNLSALSGISLPNGNVKISGLKKEVHGAILVTHWGLSGPAILKLSALAAAELNDYNYLFEIVVNWISENQDNILAELKKVKVLESKKQIGNVCLYKIPQRFWQYLLNKSNISIDLQWANLTKKEMQTLAENLTTCSFKVTGKSTNKDEFVSAGGVLLKEINLKTFESKVHENLYFAGEILNMDGLTGGFNFQSAWTGAFLAAEDISHKINHNN